MSAAAIVESTIVPVESLEPYPGNARKHNLAVLRQSLRKNGQYRQVVVQSSTRFVLAGNGTLEAAIAEGWTEIAVTFVDCDDETAKRINLVDNRSNDLAGYDEAALLELLESLDDLEGTGFELTDLDELLGDAGMTPGKDTDARPAPDDPESERGDLLLLGDHRLVCGDATSPADVALLLDGDRPDVLFTDPPYGMSYRAFDGKFDVIEGDDLRGDDLKALVHDSLALARTHLAPHAGTYVWCSWRTYGEFVEAIAAAGFTPSGCIVWKKGRVGPGNAHYRPEHEFCLYCRPDVDNDHELCVYCAGDVWEGGRGQSDVWEVSRDTGYVHPTQKPVALAERALEHTTKRGAVVLDVLAAENLKRRARLMELDPAYVDVIVDRWERHTGQKAERIRAESLETVETRPARAEKSR